MTYDWGEALVALNVCVRPMVDELFLVGLAALAERQGDYADAQVLRSFADDGVWQRAWTDRLLRLARGEQSDAAIEARDAISRWIDDWRPRAAAAIRAVAPNLGPDGAASAEHAYQSLATFVQPFIREGRDAA